jgi:sulfonate transport system ATP-binding protein
MAPHSGQLKPAVHVANLVRRFAAKTILDGVDLDIGEGEFVALLGKSGSGKSTFLKALAGLDHEVEGTGTFETPEKLSVVFQDARLLPWRTVIQNVTLGLPGETGQEAGRKALAEVGLEGRETAWPNQLSGGEQQRVALARSLVREPALLLADEPFGALDALTRARLQDELLKIVARTRSTVVMVTHDVDEAVLLSDRIVMMTNGPAATIGQVLAVDLPRPRERIALAEDPHYMHCRKEVLDFLYTRQGHVEPMAA